MLTEALLSIALELSNPKATLIQPNQISTGARSFSRSSSRSSFSRRSSNRGSTSRSYTSSLASSILTGLAAGMVVNYVLNHTGEKVASDEKVTQTPGTTLLDCDYLVDRRQPQERFLCYTKFSTGNVLKTSTPQQHVVSMNYDPTKINKMYIVGNKLIIEINASVEDRTTAINTGINQVQNSVQEIR